MRGGKRQTDERTDDYRPEGEDMLTGDALDDEVPEPMQQSGDEYERKDRQRHVLISNLPPQRFNHSRASGRLRSSSITVADCGQALRNSTED
jgi:hypothetical protein